MLRRRQQLSTCMFALIAGLSISTPAFAQDKSAEDVPEGEIIVTATRSESLASKTPVALTAVSGEALIAAGITNPTTLAEQVPNLSIDRANGGIQITIRGVTSADSTEKGDPSAAFMTDGIYLARTQAQEVSFFDLARVEVLRGPQGTLFGRNTTAGLVNVITSKPELGRFSGSLDMGYGSYDTQQATGVLNVPLSEKVAIRAAVNYDRRDSYLIAGSAFTSGLDPFKKNLSGRLSALFDLGKGKLLLRGDYSSMKGTTLNAVLPANFFSGGGAGVDPVYIGGGNASEALRTINVAYPSALSVPLTGPLGRDNNTWGLLADFSYDLGPVTVNYLGSYREFVRHEDGVILRGNGTGVSTRFDGNYWQNSQELRLSTSGHGPLKAQAGLYYFKEQSGIGYFAFNFPGRKAVFGFPQDPTISESWAGFGQLTYSLTDRFRVTGGIRYSHDNKSRIGFAVNCATLACNTAGDTKTPNIAKRSFSKTTWRLGADFDVAEHTLLYGVVATGYKAGGFNDGCEVGTTGCGTVVSPATSVLPAGALYYAPETLTSYEIGLKTRFADNAVRLNASAFHYDYKNIQLTSISSDCNCAVTTNASTAKVDGVELEGVISPAKSSRFDFSVAWLNARYSSFFPTTAIDWKDKKLDRSPELTFTAGYTQTFELGNGGNIQAGVRTRVSGSFRLAAFAFPNQYLVPSYTKTDLLIAFNAPGNRWYLQGFVKNIEDSIVVTTAAPGGGGGASAQIADPRTYGVRAGFKF